MLPINASKLAGTFGNGILKGIKCGGNLLIESIHKPSPISPTKARGLSSRLGSNRKERTRLRLGYEVASHFLSLRVLPGFPSWFPS